MPGKKFGPLVLGKGGDKAAAADCTLHLPAGTRLVRAYTQPPKTPARALAFNPNSSGRASPVFGAAGAADPALYAAVDSEQGAVLEMLYHTVLKKYPQGAVLPVAVFANVKLLTLELTVGLELVSIEMLQRQGLLAPPNFSQPRTDYSDTQRVANALYARYPHTAGLCWHSAQGPAVVAVLYASRTPPAALKALKAPLALMKSDLADFVAEVLAYHGVVLSTA